MKDRDTLVAMKLFLSLARRIGKRKSPAEELTFTVDLSDFPAEVVGRVIPR